MIGLRRLCAGRGNAWPGREVPAQTAARINAPAEAQPASVGSIPTLKRNIATIAPAASTAAQGSSVARTGTLG